MDQIILPFRFIPDGEPLPDLSGYRDPIVLHARFESDDRAPSPSAPSAHEPGSVTTLDAAESARLRRIDPPIAAVYPEAWLLGGFAIRTMGLHVLRAIGRRVLSPEIEAPSQARTDGNAGNTPSSATQPRSPDTTVPANVQITPRQVQSKFKHAADFGVEGAWNSRNGERFVEAIRNFVDKPGIVRIFGRYRGKPAIIYYEPSTSRAIITDIRGEFISGWRLGDSQRALLLNNSKLW